MAEIYRAKTFGAAGFEKEFAIKLILPSLVDDNEFVEMFINEAKIAVSLYHANIVQVFDLGEIDGQYYIAMEYVLGKDLLEVLARCAERGLKIPLNLVLFITMEMLKGLNFAHRAKDPFGDDLNIIHRDVSPSNIMLSYAGDVKVGDFGVAKAAIQRNLTESGTLKGKVGYMSPEQVMGDEIDARSDIFAAGVVFFEALSMSRLFVGGSDLEVMLQVRDANIKESLNKAEPLPQGLRTIVERALTKHPEERYQTSSEFYQALVDFCYQHSIKVTGTDLSNFIRRLFAEEIEEEKSKRRAEPRLQPPSPESRAPKSRASHKQSPIEQVAASAGKDLGNMPISEAEEASQPDSDASPQRPDSDERAAPSRPSRRVGEPSKKYRYRDASGLIYGPMGLDTLVGLVTEQDELRGDKVSIDGGDWLGPEEVEALRHRGVEIPAEPESTEPEPEATPEPSAPPELQPADKPDTVRTPVAAKSSQQSADSEMASELQSAVASRDEISRGISEASVADALNTIPFEISSSVFADKQDGHSVEFETTIDEDDANEAIQELKNQYASYEGRLDLVPFARLLARLHRSGATGRLNVRHGTIEKSIYMRDGEPVLVESNKKEELLGSFLLSRGRISQGELDEALDRLSEWGGRLGDALVAIGAIEAHDIFELLAEQMREKLLDVFTWPAGGYGYYENQEPDTMGYPLGIDTYSTIVEACRTDIPLTLIKKFYSGREHVSIYRADSPPIDVDRLKLSSRELRILTRFEAGSSLNSLLDETAADRRNLVMRTVYLLHQVEILKFEVTDKSSLPGE